MYKAHAFLGNYGQVNPYPNYNAMINHVDSQLLPVGFIKEELGMSQDGDFMLYGYKKANAGKPYLWIDSNIHGSEWWTVYYCLDFLKGVWGGDYFDKKVVNLIKDNYSVYFIPSVNPWGYHNNKYYQSRGVNLNRNFPTDYWEGYVGDAQWKGNNYKGEAPASEAETKAVVAKFDEILPAVAINCHTTTGGANGIDRNYRFKHYSLLSTDMFATFKLTMPQVPTMDWNGQYSPQAQAYYGSKVSKDGRNIFTTILEHQSDTDKYNTGLTFLYIIALTLLNHIKSGKLKLSDTSSILKRGD
ncbi:M14 family metallopeptidase [Macrococcus bovicus]|uniref:DUF2817 domain-containing protein n=1 Tax=Macrococcus bovicus TaxID=69968 RepID=A0A4R6C2V9_9STAP|nr:M14 family metallopeptidase [Macrococcus bovicus]TDM15694.1 DUF2817 domain-containing protein [Macrococcus bovicus]